jgi:hypothetical protein
MPIRNEESGQYTQSYPLDQFIHALDGFDGEVGTKEVQEVVGCEYRTAIAKLHELEDAGKISSRRVGNAYLWSVEENALEQSIDESTEDRDESPEKPDEDSLSKSGIYDPMDDVG